MCPRVLRSRLRSDDGPELRPQRGFNVKFKAAAAAALCAASVIGFGGSAFAGEVTGTGQGTPLNARVGPTDRVGNAVVSPSRCAFSGLEDHDGGTVVPGEVQTPKGAPGSVVAAYCGGPADGNINKP